MMSFGDRVPVGDRVPASDTETRTQPVFRRVLIPVEDASQVEHVVELARRAGVNEARVLHLNLRESIGGRRFALETESSASTSSRQLSSNLAWQASEPRDRFATPSSTGLPRRSSPRPSSGGRI
jgi:hypothetical protein